MAQNQCFNTTDPIGSECGARTPLTIIKGMLLTLSNFEFTSFANACGSTKILEGIRDQQIFPIMNLDDTEYVAMDDNKTEYPTGNVQFNFEGIRKFVFKLGKPLDVHQKLRNFSFGKFRVIFLDMNGKVQATSPDGTKVKGFKVAFLRVRKQNWQGYATEIELNLSDNEEWDSRGVILETAWDTSEMDGLTKVEITPSTVNQSTHVFTVLANYVDATQKDSSGASLTVPISGLLAANFLVHKVGVDCAIDSVAESATTPGLYTVTCAVGLLTTGDVKIIPTTDNLYISDVETLSAP